MTYEDQEDVVFELEVITDVELLDEPENTRAFSDEYKLVEDGIPEGEETDELMEGQSELLGQLWEDDSHWSHAIEQWFLSDEEFAVLGFVISPARDKLIRERKVRQLFPQGDGSESEIRLIELKGDYNHLKMWDRSKYETGLGGILQMKQGVRIPNLVEAYEYPEGVNQKIKLAVALSYAGHKDVVLNLELYTDEYEDEDAMLQDDDGDGPVVEIFVKESLTNIGVNPKTGRWDDDSIPSVLDRLLSHGETIEKHHMHVVPRIETKSYIREEQI
ncbi:MAG TPA: hypothetical protein EYG63_00660, partial [Gammaproteobacteria bacterium]|nr:hypothetical protein [Gammaproteobacteria bacterium]